jgi:carbamoyltransferase
MNKIKVLGIIGLGKSPAACIFENGKMLACAEEERFIREKIAKNKWPVHSIKYCLSKAGITLEMVDNVAVGWNCNKYPGYMAEFFSEQEKLYPKKGTSFRDNEADILRKYSSDNYLANFQAALQSARVGIVDQLDYYDHHECHASMAFNHSSFDEALVFIMDGSGEDEATTIWLANKNKLEKLKAFRLPHSLGRAYSCITEFLGFRAYTDEGKVMGLAPYGHLDPDIHEKVQKLLYIHENGYYTVNPDLIYYGKHSHNPRFTDDLVELLGLPRIPLKRNEEISDHYKNIAFSIQYLLEQAVGRLVQTFIQKTGIKKVCIGGGVAMNCKMNGFISELTEVEDLFVHPASHDGGACIGAAMLSLQERVQNISFKKLTHAYFGPSYDDQYIKSILDYSKLKWKKLENPAPFIAERLAKGKIIALLQGKMELGARALGNRSILANPLLDDTKKILNDHVKHRENWRPFCPSILEEYGEEYFQHIVNPWYMVVATKVRDEKAKLIPSAVHIDGTARPQFVSRKTNPYFWEIIEEFRKITNVPIIINTSFNIMGEPIINKPEEAIRCFYSTGLDVLVLEKYILSKE